MRLVGQDITSISVGGRVYLPGADGTFDVPVDDALAALAVGHVDLMPTSGEPVPTTTAQPASPPKAGARGRR